MEILEKIIQYFGYFIVFAGVFFLLIYFVKDVILKKPDNKKKKTFHEY